MGDTTLLVLLLGYVPDICFRLKAKPQIILNSNQNFSLLGLEAIIKVIRFDLVIFWDRFDQDRLQLTINNYLLYF